MFTSGCEGCIEIYVIPPAIVHASDVQFYECLLGCIENLSSTRDIVKNVTFKEEINQ